MHLPTLVASTAFAWLAISSVAFACSDAGPSNECNPGGAAWIACSSHDDCPSGQLCGERDACICHSCDYGEECEGESCQCARQSEPAPEDGCVVVGDSCGGYVQDCEAPADGSGGGGCSIAAASGGSSAPLLIGLGLLALLWRRRGPA